MHLHSFHIPVMGIGFTIDSPIKVAHLGISSAISLVDDILCERMREFYSSKYGLPFTAIPSDSEDSRAQRITKYLNMVNAIVNQKFSQFKELVTRKQDELENFIALLPTTSELRIKLQQALQQSGSSAISELIEKHLRPGSIDVNIMTKLDKENYRNNEKLPSEFNDAHAALRGFALSELTSSLILSAGMNPRLYSYLEQFDDFYPSADSTFRKKIILKVSDYRSAIIQGKFLAKKGLWISEFRVESGLNCGGHAFASQGYLMGPILAEFSNNRSALQSELFGIYAQALQAKNKPVPATAPEMKLTAQGGVGTAEEHNYLMQRYHLDSIGWGSPFLLVPEAASVDEETIDLLANAGEEDYYLSDISPVGVMFNNVKGNSRDLEKQEKINLGKPGAACTKKFVLLNSEFTDRPICTASRQYQKQKIDDLNKKGLTGTEYQLEFNRITAKACICNGLGSSTLKSHGLDTKNEGAGVSVCPGPNLAYFNRKASLKEMVDHIYGRINLISSPHRPNLFVKELNMYLDYISKQFNETSGVPATKTIDGWNEYLTNLTVGIEFYKQMFSSNTGWAKDTCVKTLQQLETSKQHLANLKKVFEELKVRKEVLV